MSPKAKAPPMRRPASRGPVRRRPAGEEKEEKEEEPAIKAERRFSEVKPQELLKLGPVCMQEAVYYGRTVHVAGHLVALHTKADQLYAELKVTGTKDEELLRVLSGKRPRHLSVHLCGEDCSQAVTDEDLIHSKTFQTIDLKRLPWLTSLEDVREEVEGEDELAKLRAEQERREKLAGDRAGEPKEKKRKKEEKRQGEGRVEESPKKDSEELEAGQKELKAVFSNTGMDPDAKKRGRLFKKAKKVGRKKKKRKKKESASSSPSKGSSGSSSSSSTNSQADGLFDEELRVKKIWKRFPGILTAQTLGEAKQSLLTGAGTLWGTDKSALPPIFIQYGRSQLMPLMGPAVQQECLTLCTALDFLHKAKLQEAWICCPNA